MARFVREGTMQTEIIRLSKKLVTADEFHAGEIRGTANVSDHAHTEGKRHGRNGFADRTEPEDAERFPLQLTRRKGEIGEGFCIFPISVCHGACVIVRAGSEMQNQREGMLCDGVRGIAGHVANANTSLLCRLDVDIIVARRKKTDEFQLGTSRHHPFGDLRLVNDHSVAVADGGNDLLGGQNVKITNLSDRLQRSKGNIAVCDRTAVKNRNFHRAHLLFFAEEGFLNSRAEIVINGEMKLLNLEGFRIGNADGNG